VPHNYFPHTDTCAICSRKTVFGRPLKSDTATLSLKEMDTVFKDAFFEKFANVAEKQRVYCRFQISENNLTPEVMVTVHGDRHWTLNVIGNEISRQTLQVAEIDTPEYLDKANIPEFVSSLSKIKICRGNHNHQDVIKTRLEQNLKEPFSDIYGG